METVTLTNYDSENKQLTAVITPSHGMNLLSYKRDSVEVMDQSTHEEFLMRYSGHGPLIGPHFHEFTQHTLPSSVTSEKFPHVKIMQERKRKDPFSHGIARYAPWSYVHSGTQIQGELHGKDLWNGVPLQDIEGQDFEMRFEARLLSTGLFIKYSIQSEKPSVIGLHYYFALQGETSYFQTHVRSKLNDNGTLKAVPQEVLSHDHELLHLPLDEAHDCGFYPLEDEKGFRTSLVTQDYTLNAHYFVPNSMEFMVQVYRPENAPYCCIEPLSAQEPRMPVLTHSQLECKLEIHPSPHSMKQD